VKDCPLEGPSAIWLGVAVRSVSKCSLGSPSENGTVVVRGEGCFWRDCALGRLGAWEAIEEGLGTMVDVD